MQSKKEFCGNFLTTLSSANCSQHYSLSLDCLGYLLCALPIKRSFFNFTNLICFLPISNLSIFRSISWNVHISSSFFYWTNFPLFHVFLSTDNSQKSLTLILCYVKQTTSFLEKLAHLLCFLWVTQSRDSGKYMPNI